MNPSSVFPATSSSPPLSLSVFPPEWSDDNVMSAMFSVCDVDDAADFAAKSSFWLQFIERWTAHSHVVSFTVDDVVTAANRHGDVPQCIGDVITDAVRRGRLTADDRPDTTSLSAIIRAFTHLFTSNTPPTPLRRYADSRNLHRRCAELCDAVAASGTVRGVFDVDNVIDRLDWSVNDCEFVIRECIRIGRIRALNLSGSEAVAYKLISASEADTALDGGSKTDERIDVTVARLERAIRRLNKDIAHAQSQLDSLTSAVRSAIKSNTAKPLAPQVRARSLRLLRTRALIQRRMDLLTVHCSRAEELLFAVGQSSANAELIRLITAANAALRTAAVDIDNANEVVAESAELVSDVAAVDAALSRDVTSVDGNGDADIDIERELAELINDEPRIPRAPHSTTLSHSAMQTQTSQQETASDHQSQPRPQPQVISLSR